MDLVTTVLPWVKGKTYSPDELQEAARDFYGPHAHVLDTAANVTQLTPTLGYLEAGHYTWAVVEGLCL